MKKLFLFALTAIMLSCGNKLANNNESTEDVAKDSTEVAVSEPSARDEYTFETSFRKDENGQCDALILTCKKGEKAQEFVCEFNWPKDEEYLTESGSIDEVDLNFDGTPDLLVYLGDFGVNPGLFPMDCYAAFIWDGDGFKHADELDNVANLQVDAEKKILTSQYMNPAGDVYQEVYAWKNSKFEMIEETSHNEFDEDVEE